MPVQSLHADVAVSCGAPAPKAIFEILSPSTEGYDRGAITLPLTEVYADLFE